MLNADEILRRKMVSEYEPKVKGFFEDLSQCGFSDEELNAVPALFLPGWGEAYSSSILKIAIAGKETLYWGNDFGDSLLHDFNAAKDGSYTPSISCKRYRDQGPAEWFNKFWQYAAESIGRLFEQNKYDVLSKSSPVLRSIAWFNGHAIETIDSDGVDKGHISAERMNLLQSLADKHGLSSFETFISVFEPHVIIYFYRDTWGVSMRNLNEASGCEFIRSWGEGDAIREYRLGDTIILNMRHTTWMTKGHMKEQDCADLVAEVLKARGLAAKLPSSNTTHYEVWSMSALMWRQWVAIVRSEAERYPEWNNWDLSRHLILTVARELRKTGSTMTAHTLVLLLNEVDKFRNECWQYSPERRGPCSAVRGAYNAYANNGEQADADLIAESFTKFNGEMAYN